MVARPLPLESGAYAPALDGLPHVFIAPLPGAGTAYRPVQVDGRAAYLYVQSAGPAATGLRGGIPACHRDGSSLQVEELVGLQEALGQAVEAERRFIEHTLRSLDTPRPVIVPDFYLALLPAEKQRAHVDAVPALRLLTRHLELIDPYAPTQLRADLCGRWANRIPAALDPGARARILRSLHQGATRFAIEREWAESVTILSRRADDLFVLTRPPEPIRLRSTWRLRLRRA